MAYLGSADVFRSAAYFELAKKNFRTETLFKENIEI